MCMLIFVLIQYQYHLRFSYSSTKSSQIRIKKASRRRLYNSRLSIDDCLVTAYIGLNVDVEYIGTVDRVRPRIQTDHVRGARSNIKANARFIDGT